MLLLFLSLCLLSVNGYISAVTYYGWGYLQPGNAVYGSNSNGQNQLLGYFLVTYDGSKQTFNYQVMANLKVIGSVTLNGPSRCVNQVTGNYLQSSASQCVVNTAPVIQTLGTGVVVKAGQSPPTNLQLFKGSLTFTTRQEEMLFNGELYIQMTTIVPTPDGSSTYEKPALRGSIYMLTNYGNYPGNSNQIFAILNFGGNNGEFGQYTSKTQNGGFGVITTDAADNTLYYSVYHSLTTPGPLLLQCGGTRKTIQQSGSSPFMNQIDLTATPILLTEITASKECYFFITSSDFNNGELFSWITLPSIYEVTLTGSALQVVSAYYAHAVILYDEATKVMDIIVRTNLTAGVITGATIQHSNGTFLCSLSTAQATLPWRSNCYLNATWVPELQAGNMVINIQTQANPKGELQGKIGYGGGNAAPQTGLSQAAQIGIALGIVIPIVLIAAGVGIYFLVKKRSSNKI